MTVLVGKQAPNFKAKCVFEKNIKDISLDEYRGKYVLLFFYPLDFTFVCPTELHAFQQILSEFESHDCVILGCSVDSQYSHLAWLSTPRNKGGIEGVQYGLVSDLGGKIAEQYDVLSEEGVAYRGLFLIDKDGIVRHQSVNDLPLGRNVPESLRTLLALKHVEEHGEVCPANWNKGETAIEPTAESVSNYLARSNG